MSVLPSVECPDTVRSPTSAPELVTNPNTAPLVVREVHAREPLTDSAADISRPPEEYERVVPEVPTVRAPIVPPPAVSVPQDREPEVVRGVEINIPPEEYERVVPEVPTVREPTVPPPAVSVPQDREPETLRLPKEPDVLTNGREDVMELQTMLPETVMAEETRSEPEL
jgi:hypothetical protein